MKKQFENKIEITNQEELHQVLSEIGYYVDEGITKDDYSEKLCRMVDAYSYKVMGVDKEDLTIVEAM